MYGCFALFPPKKIGLRVFQDISQRLNSNTMNIPNTICGPSWPWSYGSWIYNYLSNQCLSPLMLWVWISVRARWPATARWFSLGPSVSSTNKTNRHDVTEILLKVALNTIKQTPFVKLQIISTCSFSGEDLAKKSEEELFMVAIFFARLRQNEEFLLRTYLPTIIPVKFVLPV